MARSWSKFGRKQELAIAALMTQPTLERAARATGVSLRTLSRWLQVPEFAEAYRRARLDASSPALALLQKVSPNAVVALHNAMADKKTPAAVRVRAADCFLNHAMKAREIDVAEARAAAARTNTEFTELLLVREITQTTALCRRDDLGVHPHVAATEPCRAEQDRLQEFFRDRCLVAAAGESESWKREKCWVPVADLYLTYTAWEAETGNPHPLPKGLFEEKLRQLGREKERVRPAGRRETRQVWVWLGIRFHAVAKLPV